MGEMMVIPAPFLTFASKNFMTVSLFAVNQAMFSSTTAIVAVTALLMFSGSLG